MPRQKRKQPAASFNVGDKVRVRHGAIDTDFPDMPLGGWAGTITDVHDDAIYRVRWSEETLSSIHPVFNKRCENNGLEFETYWLDAEDLEADAGGPLDIQQPTEITTKPLSPKNREDRIRMIFGLTSNDPLPQVDGETLKIYYEFLSKNLAFPFTAEHGEEYGHPERGKVIGLGDPDDESMINETHGILCETRLEGYIVTLPLGELEEPSRNRPLIRDYGY